MCPVDIRNLVNPQYQKFTTQFKRPFGLSIEEEKDRNHNKIKKNEWRAQMLARLQVSNDAMLRLKKKVIDEVKDLRHKSDSDLKCAFPLSLS